MCCPNRPRGFGKTPPSGGGGAVPTAGGNWPPSAAGDAGVHRRECRRPAAGAKGGKGTVWFPCPLLTPPNPPLRRDSLRSRGETGVRGLGSGRRADFGTLLCPEFTLRYPPRITVRGHSVQGANAVAAADRQDADISQTQKEHRFASVLFRVM